MSAPKVWLTTMCNGGSEENLREMIDPIIEWLDGVIVVVHDAAPDDPGVKYLETVKGEGKIIHRSFVQRHDFSMNETLFAGIIQEDDFVIWTDLLERPAAKFVSRIKGDIAEFMGSQGLDGLSYYGKMFVLKYRETMQYVGSPHWWLHGATNVLELSEFYPNEADVRLNVRPIKRKDPLNFVLHYARYMLMPPGSNHSLLGLEKWGGDLKSNFEKRDKMRLDFRREVRKRGYPLTTDGVIQMFKDGLDDTLKDYLNAEKTWNDLYRVYVLGDKSVVDTHDPKDMKEIE